MPKKHSGSKKSKSEKQSRVQQWVARFRTFTDKAGKIWEHRGPNRYDERKQHSLYRSLHKGRNHAGNKGRSKAKAKARRRRNRRSTRALHQRERRRIS